MKHFSKPLNIDPVGIRQDQALDEAEEILTSPGTGEWFIVPYTSTSVACTLYFSEGGSGFIQTTNDLYENVVNNTAIPEDWDYGIINTSTTKYCEAVKAIRLVNVSGTVRMVLLSRIV